MFRQKQLIQTKLSSPETDGLELNIRLSGPTIVKLLSITVAVLFGSGVLVRTTSTKNPLAESSERVVDLLE
ncbi:MAG: hypothetical protein AAF572_09360 [Cyanobacteria bacterium P01_B01_bin.77]